MRRTLGALPSSRWTFVVEHAGSPLTDREVKGALPAPLRAAMEIVHVESPDFEPPDARLIKLFGRGLSAADEQRAAATKRETALVGRARTGAEARALMLATQKAALQLA